VRVRISTRMRERTIRRRGSKRRTGEGGKTDDKVKRE
jgi:hypothetical protein